MFNFGNNLEIYSPTFIQQFDLKLMSEDPLNENDNPKELSIKIMHIKQVKLEDNESEFTNYLGRFFK